MSKENAVQVFHDYFLGGLRQEYPMFEIHLYGESEIITQNGPDGFRKYYLSVVDPSKGLCLCEIEGRNFAILTEKLNSLRRLLSTKS